MRRRSGLDRLIFRFQDRWETDRQFRAMISGVLGLVMIVALCSCMGVVTTVANSAFAKVSAARDVSAPRDQNSDTGVAQISGVPTFPTATAPSWTQSDPPTPNAIPFSQTPEPSPTALPTATPQPTVGCSSNCGGGGNTGGGSTFSATLSGTASPAIWTAGNAGSFTVYSTPDNVGLAIVITFPGGGTYLDEHGEVTSGSNGSGSYTANFTVPGGTTAGNADVWVQAYYNGVKKDFHFPVPCQP